VSRRRRSRTGCLGGLFPLLLAAAVAWGLWSYSGPGPAAKNGDATTVILDRGAGVSRIGRTLHAAGVIGSPLVFDLAVRLTGAASHLRAGEYSVPSHASMAAILADIRAGKVVRHVVAVPEGWTSDMAVEALKAQAVLTGDVTAPPEGSILPDTYLVQRGESRAAVLARMQAAQTALLTHLWAHRQPGLPLATPQDAVTLASIVEKETGKPEERRRVAAIFVNRLRAGMKLESDPTIIYSLTRGRPLGRGIRASELAAVTPYNSYKVAGLPPTPIANPGRASLEAVLDPPKTDELYFVADGTGGHAFASTYAEHAVHVAHWRQIEAQRAAAIRP
jgi:UPF0755 protein